MFHIFLQNPTSRDAGGGAYEWPQYTDGSVFH